MNSVTNHGPLSHTTTRTGQADLELIANYSRYAANGGMAPAAYVSQHGALPTHANTHYANREPLLTTMPTVNPC
jgi:hypothetical protein